MYGIFNPTGEVTAPDGFRAVYQRPGLVLLERPGCIGGTLSHRGDSVLYLFGEIYNVQDVWPASDGSGDDLTSLHELLAAPDWLERLPDLNGSFHITAFDARARRLRLIADRHGQYPCFYGARDGRLCFFPHVSDFLALGFPARLDGEMVAEMVAFRWLFDHRTVTDGVRLLPHGSALEADAAGETVRRYWRYRFDERRDDLDDPDAAARELAALWVPAVERRLRGKGRVLLPLSGGLDSRAVLGAALECVPADRLVAVTYGTPGSFDFEIGRQVARAAGVRHRAIDLSTPHDHAAEYLRKARDSDGLADVLWSFLSDWHALADLSEHVITGFAGDGITSMVVHPRALDPCPADERAALELVRQHHQGIPSDVVGRLCGMRPEAWDELAVDLMARVNEGNDHRRVGAYALAWFLGARLQPYTTMLVHKVRERFRYLSPFLDNAVFDFLLAVPMRWLAGQRLYRRMLVRRFPRLFALPTRNENGRPLLEGWLARVGRRAARSARKRVERWSGGRLPLHSAEEERVRRGRVIGQDLTLLLREAGPFQAMCVEQLTRLADRGLVEADAMWALWHEHRRGEANRRRALGVLVSLEFIAEAFVDREVAAWWAQAGGSSSSSR